jgi:DNA-binding NtrC family response regulator
MTPEVMQALQTYSWPGNVRELENLLERAAYLALHNTITLADLPPEIRSTREHQQHQLAAVPAPPAVDQTDTNSKMQILVMDLKQQSLQTELEAITRAYNQANGQMSRTAALLGISRTTLWRKMARYGLLDEQKKKGRKNSC